MHFNFFLPKGLAMLLPLLLLRFWLLSEMSKALAFPVIQNAPTQTHTYRKERHMTSKGPMTYALHFLFLLPLPKIFLQPRTPA